MALQEGIGRGRADSAIDEIFAGYAAAKHGKKFYKALIDARGSVFSGEEKRKSYTPEVLALAERRAKELVERAKLEKLKTED